MTPEPLACTTARSTMTPEPLEVLKMGLASLKRQIATKKNHLTTRLKNKQPISEDDEAWLDNAGNTVFGRQTRVDGMRSTRETKISDFFHKQ